MYTVFEAGTHGEREYTIFSWLANNGVIWLSDINDKTVDMICGQILYRKKSNIKDLSLFINSDGGEVNAMLTLVNFMENFGVEVNTFCVGRAYSAAAILLLAGKKRYISPNATVMFHDISYGNGGTFKDVSIHQQHIHNLREKIKAIISRRTNWTPEQIEKRVFDRDYYLTAEEALAAGVVDEITTNIKV